MNFAVLIDLNSARMDFDVFSKALDELKRDYNANVIYSKFYSYNSKRYACFNAFVKREGSEVALALQNRKKVKIDIRQVIDGVALANGVNNIDGFFVVCSKVDSLPFLQALKSKGKTIVLGIENGGSVPEFCNSILLKPNAISEQCEIKVACEEVEENKLKDFPFSVVEGEKEMSAVTRSLSGLINEKLYGKKFTPKGEELENLLKKYF